MRRRAAREADADALSPASAGGIESARGSGEAELKTVLADYLRCLGCRSCEVACAVEHSPARSLVSALSSATSPRVRVEAAGPNSFPVRCQHCSDAPCVFACPTGALSREGPGTPVLLDDARCIGCWMCVAVCPFGALFTGDGVVLKCDLCPERTVRGEDPACVAACPSRALRYVEVEEWAEGRRKVTAEQVAGAGQPPAVHAGVEAWRALRPVSVGR